MAVGTVEQLLAVLEKSKLLGAEQLAAARRLAQDARDPSEFAKALVRKELLSPWQAATLRLLGEQARLIFGRYKLISPLGKGGMGKVFLAEHVTMNRRVALKIVPRQVSHDRASLERFFAEARAIAALDHPNIVQAYSVDNESEFDRYFIVMEYVDGQDLQQMVEVEGPLDFDRAADYIRQAADGLAHAHARKMIHCDVKPSNLLVNHQGVVKILDLGLARLKGSELAGPGKRMARTLGTVDYLAPEQALEGPNFDHRADIYALGCTFYFLLTGRPPFGEGTLAERIVRHQTQEPRDIIEQRPDAPPALVEICRRMMAKRPEDRYQTAAAVSQALLQWKPAAHAAVAVIPLKVAQPLGDDLPAGDAGSDAWWNAITSSPAAGRGKAHASTPWAGGKPPASLADVLREKLQWFNTPQRKVIVAAVAGVLVAATIIGAIVLVLPSRRESAPPRPVRLGSREMPSEKKAAPARRENPRPEKTPAKTTTEPAKPKVQPEPSDVPAPPKNPADHEPGPTPAPGPAVTPPSKPDVKPEVKPAPKPETQPKVKPAPAKQPVLLDGLPRAVELPLPGRGAGKPFVLGKFAADPTAVLEIKLLGGEVVAKGNPLFTLRPAAEGQDPGWYVQAGSKAKPAVDIARIWPRQQEIAFQWLPDAKLRPDNLLHNCGLLISCEKHERFMALTKPTAVAPLAVDLDQGFTKVRLTREAMPDLALLRLQVDELGPPFPRHNFKVLEPKSREPKPHDAKAHESKLGKPRAVEAVPGNTTPVKGHLKIELIKEKTPPAVLDITLEPRGRDLLVEMIASCELGGRTVPFQAQRIAAAAARLENMSEPAGHSGRKTRPAAPTDTAKAFQEQAAALGILATELRRGKVRFRIFLPVGKAEGSKSYNVILFATADDEKPPAGAKKGSKK